MESVLEPPSGVHPPRAASAEAPTSTPRPSTSARGFATDVVTAIAHGVPLVSARAARGFAEAIVGGDLRTTFPAPDPAKDWHDASLADVDATVRTVLEARIGPVAPYVADASTSRRDDIVRTKLSPTKLAFEPQGLSMLAATAARFVVGGLSGGIAKTRTYVYAATSADPGFATVRARVRAAETVPKGRILRALQPLLRENEGIFAEHGADVAIVRVPGIAHHPTYVATTLAGVPASRESPAGPTALALCKLETDPKAAELEHLDAFARSALRGTAGDDAASAKTPRP